MNLGKRNKFGMMSEYFFINLIYSKLFNNYLINTDKLISCY